MPLRAAVVQPCSLRVHAAGQARVETVVRGPRGGHRAEQPILQGCDQAAGLQLVRLEPDFAMRQMRQMLPRDATAG
eukprot:8545120-Lingulodinium_polyedra.AAC.1